MSPFRSHPSRDSESGFVLLAVICLLVLFLISLAIAAPKVAQSIQRDKDLETIHRGEQYEHAIKLYYHQFRQYPTSVDQLLDTNNMRFLRQKYADPLTGKVDWKPVYYGHAHVHPLGFFGKPLSAIGGIAAASTLMGSSGGMYAIESNSTDANGNSADDSSDDGFGSSSDSNGQSAFGSSSGGDMFSGQSSGIDGAGSAGTGLSSSSTSASPFGSSPGGTSATTFGAEGTGLIVGFTLPVNKPSLVDYMEQTRYNKWEFNYDPVADQIEQAVSLLGGGANTAIDGASGDAATNGANGTSGTTGSTDDGFGSMNGSGTSTTGSSIFGSDSGNTNGSSTTSTPQPNSPDTPQQ